MAARPLVDESTRLNGALAYAQVAVDFLNG